MKLYRQVDEEGYFIEDVIVEDNRVVDTSRYIESHPPQGLYRPRWDGEAQQWVEGLTQTEIECIINVPVPLTPEQEEINLLRAQIKASDDRADFQEEVLTEIIMTMYTE